ncbi:MAG TPA: hypothetical protein VN379_12800, partial [Sporomusa sp.]|nr:hypothetical protein [Sporomusa sp.]
MANYNIEMKKRNAANTGWDTLYPVTLPGNVDGLQAALDAKLDKTGTAVAAIKLATARTIAVTGAVTGSSSFDGSANISLATSMAAGAGTDAALGNRTITDTAAPAADTAALTTLLSNLGYMLKTITGKTSWRTAPAITLENALPKAGGAMTGALTLAADPTAPLQAATKQYTDAKVASLVASAPGTLDTLNELAAALNDDPNFATTITNLIAGKQPLDATLTALAALTTAANQMVYATGSDTFATTTLSAFARTLLDDASAAAALATLGAAPIASPALTGTPTAPTAVVGTNTTQIASTAFVQAAVSASSSGISGFSNLKILVTGNSAATITAGTISLLNAVKNQYIASGVSLALNTAITGANGRDTGSLAVSTWYYLYVIYNPTTATVACLMSTNSTTPTLPSGYTYFARVGAVR